jgi:hypothetical protein
VADTVFRTWHGQLYADYALSCPHESPINNKRDDQVIHGQDIEFWFITGIKKEIYLIPGC